MSEPRLARHSGGRHDRGFDVGVAQISVKHSERMSWIAADMEPNELGASFEVDRSSQCVSLSERARLTS